MPGGIIIIMPGEAKEPVLVDGLSACHFQHELIEEYGKEVRVLTPHRCSLSRKPG